MVLGYHQRTKHAPGRYARALGYLDWDSQPNPFRRFAGAPLVELPRGGWRFGAGGRVAEDGNRDGDRGANRGVDVAGLSGLLMHSLALSGWKSVPGARWSLRVNPSSGNLHPTEGWLLLPPVDGLEPGGEGAEPALWHYAPAVHGLERRASFAGAEWAALAELLPPGAFLMGLSSIPWRESWKYGERAYRYCLLDAGHAVAAVALAAGLVGFRCRVLWGLGDDLVERLLGLDRGDAAHAEEPEVPELLLLLEPAGEGAPAPIDGTRLAARLAELARTAQFAGAAEALSPEHQVWEAVEVAERATRRGPSDFEALARSLAPKGRAAADATLVDGPEAWAERVRGRRSAVALDGRGELEREAFEAMLAATLPGGGPIPTACLPGEPAVHLGLFVHRVRGLEPGLYLLPRGPGALERLRPKLRAEFRFERPPGAPLDSPLVLLATGDVRRLAAHLCCDQDIGADGAFAAAMLAELGPALAAEGPSAYRRLHMEAGLVGQVLYLAAEAAGRRGTGIGCFYDDPTHAVFGLTDGSVQSLYHFTVGVPVEDGRLTSEPAYPAIG